MPIKGLSEVRRLPRIGKIRLGYKETSKGGKEYPTETDYFVVPPEVAAIYGEKTKELDIMFPVEDTDIIAKQHYELYGMGSGLKCRGDGETASQVNTATGEMEDRECPCPELKAERCKERLHLCFMLPKVDMRGVYQIDSSSVNSIIDVNSGLAMVKAAKGRVAMVMLKLQRKPTETHRDGKKRMHYTLKIELPERLRLEDTVMKKPFLVTAPPSLAETDLSQARGGEISDVPPDTIPPCEGPEEPPSQGSDFTLAAAKDVLEEGFVASGVDRQAFTEATVAKTGKLVNQWTEKQYKLANTWLNMVVDGTLHIKRMERGHAFVVVKKKEKVI